jgi:hypothetical protein
MALRAGSITTDIVEVLRERGPATMGEITRGVEARRGSVLPHSVRAAVLRHLDGSGAVLFTRRTVPASHGVYRLKASKHT